MSRQTILVAALNVFAHFGIKGVSMSQVANSIHISKRTLYSYFGSKEELLCACMDHENGSISEMLDEIDKQTSNPLESVVLLTMKISKHKSSYCPAFYRDIMQFQDASLKLKEIYARLQKIFVDYLNAGVKKGFFRRECSYEVVDYIFMEQVVLQNRSKISSLHQATMFFTFLRGVCTEKGIIALEELVPREDHKYAYDFVF